MTTVIYPDYSAFCPQWLSAQVVCATLLCEQDFPYWAYKLAREYVERYQPQYGSGLIPESVPMLLEVAEFWCQHYFGQTLSEKFLVLTLKARSELGNVVRLLVYIWKF